MYTDGRGGLSANGKKAVSLGCSLSAQETAIWPRDRWNLSLSVTQLQSSNLWQYAHELEPLTVSILQLPFTLAFVGGAFLIGRLLTTGTKPREIISVAFLVIATGFALMSLFGASPVAIAFILALMVVGFGAGAGNHAKGWDIRTRDFLSQESHSWDPVAVTGLKFDSTWRR